MAKRAKSRLYTRTGDLGDTALFGGDRIPKDHPRVEAYGSVDELNSALGAAASFVRQRRVAAVLRSIQNELFNIGSELASESGGSAEWGRQFLEPERKVAELERLVDDYDARLPSLRTFILPSGSQAGALLHLARGVCRRAERAVVRLSRQEDVNPHLIIYLNRLSDLLFVLARYVNKAARKPETEWRKVTGGRHRAGSGESAMSRDDWVLGRILQAREAILSDLNRPNVIRALNSYCWLQNSLLEVDVRADPYRRKYIGFYRVVYRSAAWLDAYFALLQAEKANNAISFARTLRKLSTEGNVEGAFSSKLVATVRPDMPPIDKWVMLNLGLRRPTGSFDERIDGWIRLHADIRSRYKSLLEQEVFEEIQDYFKSWFQQFPGLTGVKKLDILLWRLREPQNP